MNNSYPEIKLIPGVSNAYYLETAGKTGDKNLIDRTKEFIIQYGHSIPLDDECRDIEYILFGLAQSNNWNLYRSIREEVKGHIHGHLKECLTLNPSRVFRRKAMKLETLLRE